MQDETGRTVKLRTTRGTLLLRTLLLHKEDDGVTLRREVPLNPELVE